MESVPAFNKIITRIRPAAHGCRCQPPSAEVVTSHAAICPHCGTEARVALGSAATVYGGCAHVAAIEQRGTGIAVVFGSIQ